MYRKTITNDELNTLPLRYFEGEIFLIDNLAKMNEALKKLENVTVIGFDTETKPSFKRGHKNNVALLQLATDNQAFLFRLNRIGLPYALIKILINPKIIKVGAAIRDDIKILRKIKDFEPQSFIDLQDYVKSFGIENYSVKSLSGIVLGFRISKSKQLSNWEEMNLTQSQQLYAATDAWVCYKILEELDKSKNMNA